MFGKVFILLGCLCGTGHFASDAEWGYDDESNGPSSWKDSYPVCGESSQSPIAISKSEAEPSSSLGEFSRTIFAGLPTSMVLKNTGHTLEVSIEDGYTINDRALLPAEFKIGQFHLHWGSSSTAGSEHTLDEKQYFGELHLVHYNIMYGNISNAMNHSDGLAVLGFFIEDDNSEDNDAFQRILSPVENDTLKQPGSNLTLEETFTVETLLPSNFDVYYRYNGSLTTPACYESVLWTVFETPISISRKQASILENHLNSTNDAVLNGNFRPPQPLNGRKVELYTGGVSTLSHSFGILLILTLASTLILVP